MTVVALALYTTNAAEALGRMQFLLYLLAGALFVFIAELLWSFVRLPAVLSTDDAAVIAELREHLRRHDVGKHDIEQFEKLYREGEELQDGLRRYVALPLVPQHRKQIAEWDEKTLSLVKRCAPDQAFAYSTIATLPALNTLLRLMNAPNAQHVMAEFLHQKLSKLRLIVSRLEGELYAPRRER